MTCFYRTSVGKKLVVAVTGVILFGFVLSHMLGNLKIFLGYDAATGLHHMDLYAKYLREMGENFFGHSGVLWVARLGLIAAFSLHVLTVFQLYLINKRARPKGYAVVQYSAATKPARFMWWGGVLLALFIVVHLMHLTFGFVAFQGFSEGKVYSTVYRAFRFLPWVIIYLVAMVCLAFHLYHGLWSLCQTIGIVSTKRNCALRGLALLFALLLSLGFAAVPLAVYSGLLPEPPRSTGASY